MFMLFNEDRCFKVDVHDYSVGLKNKDDCAFAAVKKDVMTVMKVKDNPWFTDCKNTDVPGQTTDDSNPRHAQIFFVPCWFGSLLDFFNIGVSGPRLFSDLRDRGGAGRAQHSWGMSFYQFFFIEIVRLRARNIWCIILLLAQRKVSLFL